MQPLAKHTGAWTGTNGFRLMPTDDLFDATATAGIALAAGGNLATITYTWIHPTDGACEGFLVVGAGSEPGTAVGLWGDSWHQAPSPVAVSGPVDGGHVAVSCDYGGDWKWRITVDAETADALAITMENIIPESAATADRGAGPYPAMLTVLRRVS